MGEEIGYRDTAQPCILRDCWKPMHYHNSWDWLMPVVEKIDKTPVLSNTEEEYYYCVSLMGSVAEVMDASTSDNVVQVSTETTNWLESTYEMCVKFIKWYNKNK